MFLESEWKLRKSDCVLSKPDADQAVVDEFGAKKPQKPATWLGDGSSSEFFFLKFAVFLSFKPKSREIFICWKSIGSDPINLHHCLGKFSKKWLKIRWEIYLLFNIKQSSWIWHLEFDFEEAMIGFSLLFKSDFLNKFCYITLWFDEFLFSRSCLFLSTFVVSLCFRGEQHWFFSCFCIAYVLTT